MDLKPLPLTVVSSPDDKADEVKAIADKYKTEARFAYDAHKGFWAHHNALAKDLL